MQRIAILTTSNIVNFEIRNIYPQAVVLALTSEAQATRYFQAHLRDDVDKIYIDLDSIELSVPPMAYMLALWRHRVDMDIFLISENVEKLMDTGVSVEHFVVLPFTKIKS